MEERRRKELGDFLSKSRERRRPADAGLTAGPRRRTPGLRREEVALLAGVTPTWYTWLEQGRPINVSPRTLTAIADALGLDQAGRQYMYGLASGLPGFPDRPPRAVEVPPTVRALLDKIEPFPGCVFTHSYDVVLCNRAYAACFPELADEGAAGRNILRYFSGLDDARFSVHERLIATLIGRFRSSRGAHGDDPAWRAVAADTVQRDPRMKKYWDLHYVNDAGEGSVDIVTTPVGRITFDSASYQLSGDTELSVLVGVPRTDEDRRLVEKLVMT